MRYFLPAAGPNWKGDPASGHGTSQHQLRTLRVISLDPHRLSNNDVRPSLNSPIRLSRSVVPGRVACL